MALPNELNEALNELLDNDISFNDINYNAKEISKKYRANDNDGSPSALHCGAAHAVAGGV